MGLRTGGSSLFSALTMEIEMSGFGSSAGATQAVAPHLPNIIENGMHRVLAMTDDIQRAERNIWALYSSAVGSPPVPASESSRIEGASSRPQNMAHALDVMQQSIEKLHNAISQFNSKD